LSGALEQQQQWQQLEQQGRRFRGTRAKQQRRQHQQQLQKQAGSCGAARLHLPPPPLMRQAAAATTLQVEEQQLKQSTALPLLQSQSATQPVAVNLAALPSLQLQLPAPPQLPTGWVAWQPASTSGVAGGSSMSTTLKPQPLPAQLQLKARLLALPR